MSERPDSGAACHIQLPDSPCAAGQARRAVTDLLALWGADDDGVLDSAALLTSELVTNSLRYATPWQRGQRCIHLDVRVDTGCLRVDVRDPDTSVPSSREADEDAEHGRGLAIVAALAKDWGTTPEPDGKRVWFTLALPDSEPS